MEIKEITLGTMKAAFTKIDKQKKTVKYFLNFPRFIWENGGAKESGYDFTENELNEAEKHPQKFIGIRKGVYCYLESRFN